MRCCFLSCFLNVLVLLRCPFENRQEAVEWYEVGPVCCFVKGDLRTLHPGCIHRHQGIDQKQVVPQDCSVILIVRCFAAVDFLRSLLHLSYYFEIV